MSYAIGNVIYGVSGSSDDFNSFLLDNFEEIDRIYGDASEYLETIGFTNLYSASANFVPCYLGISISSITETEDIDLDDLYLELHQPGKEEKLKAEYQELIKDVPPAILEYLGEPKFMIVWSSS